MGNEIIKEPLRDLGRLVKDQDELDKALAEGIAHLRIEHPLGIYLTIADDPGFWLILEGNSRATLGGNARATLGGNARATLWGNSSATLWGNSRAELWDDTSAELRDDASATLWGNSSATLKGNARATLKGNARATLRDDASAELWGNSSATLWGTSRAELWDDTSAELRDDASATLGGNARATLWGNSSATLWGNSRAELSRFTVARLHSSSAKATGTGHIIDVSDAVLSAPDAWAEYHGVEVINGIATVYKALHDHYGTDRPGWRGAYAPGKAPEAPDWRDDASCGGGLHFSPTPRQASEYLLGATRWVKVGVDLATLRPILNYGTPKCKAPKVVVPCVEVDINGELVEPVIGE